MSFRWLFRAAIAFVAIDLARADSTQTVTDEGSTADISTSTPSATSASTSAYTSASATLRTKTPFPTNPADLAEIEVDFIFPRNETYYNTTYIPIAVNVQNTQSYRNPAEGYVSFEFHWDIRPYDADGFIHGGSRLDWGLMVPYDDRYNGYRDVSSSSPDCAIWLYSTNVSQWFPPDKDDKDTTRFILTVWAIWDEDAGVCPPNFDDDDVKPPISQIVFTIVPPGDINTNTRANVSDVSLANAPACPAFGAVLKPVAFETETITHTFSGYYTETITSTCSGSVVVNSTPAVGTPCSATLDATARSALDSDISRRQLGDYMATSGLHPYTPASATSTHSKNAAPAMATAMPLGPALAAAGVVYGMVY